MSISLRDQLMGLGFKPAPKEVPKKIAASSNKAKTNPARLVENTKYKKHTPSLSHSIKSKFQSATIESGNTNESRNIKKQKLETVADSPKNSKEINLAQAYALRAQKEQQEQLEAERQQQEQARQKRQAQHELAVFIKDKILNDPEADIARHFPYGGKIKRIYVTASQLKALNAGELGVVQHKGRYLLVSLSTLLEAEKLFPPAVALKVDPNEASKDESYDDPKYQIPDDLVW